MGQQGSPVISELQQTRGEFRAAATEFHDGANSRLSEVTGAGEMERNYIPKPRVLLLHLPPRRTLFLTCYQVAAWTEWNLLSPLSPPFPG